MKRAGYLLILLLSTTLFLDGCSMLTAQGRRERAYEHYVRKCSNSRVKQQSLLTRIRSKIPKLTPSDPVVQTEVGGPVAATSGDGGW